MVGAMKMVAMARCKSGAAAALALIAAMGAGCRRSDCAVPEDVSGVWTGQARDQRGERFPVQLVFARSGDDITGSYAAGHATRVLYGLRIGKRVEFDTEPLIDCAARLRGVARFCGESLDLTLDGDDCEGAYHAVATLSRTSSVAVVSLRR